MEKKQAFEIAESIFSDFISRRVVGGDYEEQALETIKQALTTPKPDLEALKREQSYSIEKEPEKFGFVKGWNAAIDHLAARGMILCKLPKIDRLEERIIELEYATTAETAGDYAVLEAAREYLKRMEK